MSPSPRWLTANESAQQQALVDAVQLSAHTGVLLCAACVAEVQRRALAQPVADLSRSEARHVSFRSRSFQLLGFPAAQFGNGSARSPNIVQSQQPSRPSQKLNHIAVLDAQPAPRLRVRGVRVG